MAKHTAQGVLLLCFYSLTAVLSNVGTGKVVDNSCSSLNLTFNNFSTELQEVVQCASNITSQWNNNQISDLLNTLQTLTDILQQHQKRICQDFKPKLCPAPEPPKDGGILCVSIKNRRYCKPMCNEGYDFAFLRRSRPYEICSAETGDKWVGGNRLAVCIKSSIRVSGAEAAYFPKDQNCLQTKSHNDLEKKLIKQFVNELEMKDIEGKKHDGCIICG
ncbi:hypothetical protein DPEC_G00016750 [Dallia pectoralis]|uniref:Uncharacterized protein n=1 Tax=Dallia pectoralis TaxID=75939 RepID=A0ACC2HNQ4_DALPE|nr:hypothetical protein DPEC_G00016750 [Dallia pectoralis]